MPGPSNNNKDMGENAEQSCTESTQIPTDYAANAAFSAIDKKIEDIQQTIISLELQQCSLRSERNRHCAISRLPNELLTNIFHLVTSPPEVELPDIDEWRRDVNTACVDAELLSNISWADLKPILHVCHAWRSVAFGCPSLWSRIIWKGGWRYRESMSSAVEEMLVKAGQYPLRLRLSYRRNAHWFDEQLALTPVLSKALVLPRIRELHVKLNLRTLGVIFSGISGSNADKLQSLYISHTSSSNDHDPHQGDELFCIPKEFLAMPMPQLVTLRLAHCEVDWDLLNTAIHSGPSQLTYLELTHVSRSTREQFYHLLSGTPLLAGLYLDDALPSPLENVLSQDLELFGTPSLVYLTYLVIISPLESCVDFQLRVYYPYIETDTCFALSCPLDAPPQAEANALIATLLGMCGLRHPRDGRLRRSHSSLIIHGPLEEDDTENYDEACGLLLRDDSFIEDIVSSNSRPLEPCIRIRFHGPGKCYNWNALALYLLTVSGVKNLRVRNMVLNKYIWVRFLELLPQIEHLYIDFDSQYPPSNLLLALLTPPTEVPIIPIHIMKAYVLALKDDDVPPKSSEMEDIDESGTTRGDLQDSTSKCDEDVTAGVPGDQTLSPASNPPKLCLPDLTKLTLRGEDYSRYPDQVIDGLYDCLTQRCNYDVPIEVLNLHGGYLKDARRRALLREVVPHLKLD